MKKLFGISFCLLWLSAAAAWAQTTEARKWEASVTLPVFTQKEQGQWLARVGAGQRLTFNVNRTLALEAESNFLPGCALECREATKGSAVQGVFGLRVGRKIGGVTIFGKVRPGLIHFRQTSVGLFSAVPAVIPAQFPVSVTTSGQTNAMLEVGGGVMVDVTRRLFTRVDVGDTIIWHRPQSFTTLLSGGQRTTQWSPVRTTHNLQVTPSFGIRF